MGRKDDTAPTPRKTKPTKPGQVPEGKLGVFDHKGRLRGHVGKLASAATAARFGVPDAELTTIEGRPAWRGKGSKQ